MMTGADPSVLFICTGNYYRSRTAEALFNHYAASRALDVCATSRGLRLNAGNKGPISKHATVWLNDRGVPYDDRDPLDLSEADLEAADRIIAVDETEHRALMAARFPQWENRTTYWTVHDIDRTAPDEALGAIESMVAALVETLSADQTLGGGAG